MKIGIISVTKNLPWAATDEVMLAFARHAAERGNEVHYSARPELQLKERIPSQFQRSIAISRRITFRPTALFHFLERQRSSFKIFEQNGVDVLVVSGGSILDVFHQPEILHYLKKTRIPVVYFCHGHSEFYEIPDRMLLRDFLLGLDAIVFAAEGNKNLVELQIATCLPNAHVIRNASPFYLENPLPWPPNVDGQANFSIVARMDAFWKGHEILFQALSFPEWKSRDWILNCHGDGKDREYLGQLAKHLDISENVRLHPHTGDIKKVWAESHALLLPTKAESFSLAVLEAMMCGRPVVCSHAGDLGEAVLNGETGVLARGFGLNEFSAALEKFWDFRTEWPEMGLRAHSLARFFYEQNPPEQLLSLVGKIIGSQMND
jgi:glycosyltransferase involved in cell wall biosynthesis